MSRELSTAARWSIWLISLASLCIAAGTRIDIHHIVDTDILSILPPEHDSAAVAAATEQSRQAFVDEMLLLVSGDDVPATRAAAQAAADAASADGLKPADSGQSLDRLLSIYQKHRYALLDEADAKRLRDGGATTLATDVATSLASPAGMVDAFGSDPGGHLSRFLGDLPRPYPNFLPEGPFFSALKDGKRWYLIRDQVSAAAFAEGGAQASRAVQAARDAALKACPSCSFEATGAPLFADAARHAAQTESIWLSVASTLLIMVLIAYIFRSFAPHVLAGTQLVASVLAASAAVILIFGSIQVITLVFGTTLIGIAIDYAFLYFAEYWFGEGQPAAVMRAIRPGLYMGLATGVVAFAFLLLAGFPALTQFAVFSVAGLIEAGLMVVLIFPVSLKEFPQVPVHPAVLWPQRFIQAACRRSRWRLLLPLAALLISIPGWFMLHTSDDVRGLQNLPPAMLDTDGHIRETLGQVPPPGFFLSEAPDQQQALRQEEALFARITAGAPSYASLGLSRFLPSDALQQQSLAAWQKVFADPKALQAAFVHLGLPKELADRSLGEWQAADHTPIKGDELFTAAPELKTFVITGDKGATLLSTVTGRSDVPSSSLAAYAAATPGMSFVDPLGRIAATFKRVRERATWLVILGYTLISALLIWRYGRREALRMLYPPLLALGLTLGVLGWLGEPVNIFVVVALILILGLGRDYAVFLREGGAERRSPALAVSLSALTMLFSFGLLAVSSIPALHVFGIATLTGILASYLSAPLSLPPTGRGV
ncbi:MAG: MMPL family transporter [Gammaproteobacteria bacterium]